MSWKFVFNTNQRGVGFFQGGERGDKENAFELAKKSGYSFMLWNNDVYFVASREKTGITLSDLI